MTVYLELFILPGINDSADSVRRFADIAALLKVDRVQLNTLDRAGAVAGIKCADEATVKRFISGLRPVVQVEAVGKYSYLNSAGMV